MKHLIKDLRWLECSKTGNSEAITLAYEYDVIKDLEGDGYVVRYYNLRNSDPAKTALGFTTREQAKEWAFNHHCEKLSKWLNTDPLTDTVNWFNVAKPEPTKKDVCTQVGCHFEEFGEMLESLEFKNIGITVWVKNIAGIFKTGHYADEINNLSDEDRINLLDALADQIVTAVGVAYMMGFDIIGALKEVNASNWSKFENGKAVTDENGKIIKGSGYFKPELEGFIK